MGDERVVGDVDAHGGNLSWRVPPTPLLPLPVDPRWAAWLGRALALAARAAAAGDVPVGALVLDAAGDVVGAGLERARGGSVDPVAHAEVRALQDAGRRTGSWRLDGCTLLVTLEPCAMCAGAAVQARVERIVLGAWDPKAGACGSVWDLARDRRSTHWVEVVGGVREDECAGALSDFFASRRLR